jgi:GT2 family glycosyltransferase
LDSIIASDYPKDNLEVLVYDGGSNDGTLKILKKYEKKHPFIKIKSNPKKIQASAMNLGIKEAKGDIIIRMDAHTIYERDYISQIVNILEKQPEVVNVGGLQVGRGNSYLTESITITVSNPFVAGNAAYRFKKDKQRYVDTVYLGAWRKKDLEEVGGFDESFAVNEDYELNYRLRKKKGKILLSPKIKSTYFVRASIIDLIKQYFRYGFWKVKTFKKHPKSLVWRQLVAPTFVLSLIFAISLHIIGHPQLLLAILFAYIIAFLTVSIITLNTKEIKYLPVFFISALSIHLSWGIGFWCGIIYWFLLQKKRNK